MDGTKEQAQALCESLGQELQKLGYFVVGCAVPINAEAVPVIFCSSKPEDAAACLRASAIMAEAALKNGKASTVKWKQPS